MASWRWRHKRSLAAGLLMLLCVAFAASPAYASLGETVTNVADVAFEQEGASFTFRTNKAEFVIQAAPTPSTITFFRFAPNADDGIITAINGSAFSPSGELSGPFLDVGTPVSSNGVVLDLSGEVSLAPAEQFLPSELIFVQVLDAGQNGVPGAIETVMVTVESEDGDSVVLQLFESGPDTGAFIGFLPSTTASTPLNDNQLTATGGQLIATYMDAFDATEVSTDTALVDPFGRLFDAVTGALIDGARVTIIDIATGAPADVFGVDGVSAYPSTLLTGSVVTDASGLQYVLEPGQFLFPLVAPADYRLEIEPPAGYLFPSSFEAADFVGLPNGPFEIIGGSFGGTFTVEATGPLNFDVPLDPAGALVVTKEVNTPTGAVGDTLGYTVQIENRDIVPAPVRIVDTLPPSFRYREGTARIGGVSIADPDISPDGQVLTFSGPPVLPGGVSRLTYAVSVGAGAELGIAVNTAIAVNNAGAPISNRAEAAIVIREELLRSRLTIVGRVAEDACEEDAEWARELRDGKGVAGVRLYMETGEFVVTDEHGLYHFEDVEPIAHVVQVDTETLPPGYEPVICEENNRYAGSAISQFVDARGGVIWRANFYLKRTGEAIIEDPYEVFDDQTAYLDFDQEWLDRQEPYIGWAYPDTRFTPSARSVNLGILHTPRSTVSLSVNGAPVHAASFSGRDTSSDKRVELSRWRGVNIRDGENVFEAIVRGPNGEVIKRLEEHIWFVTEVHRVTLVDDQSILVADGRTNPVIAVRVEDAEGHPVHGGRRIDVDLAPPYRLKDTRVFEDEAPLTAAFTTQTGVEVDADGIARIALEPTLETGRVKIRIRTDNGPDEEVDVFLRPEKRDWILVGLAEGSGGVSTLRAEGARSARDLIGDGRIAFFAKGVVKGDWLLTVAVDTAEGRGEQDTEIFDDIDPNAFYTLFGDRSFQQNDAESQFPVFVSLERNTFSALFGDYDTGLNDTELARYNRRLSGFKTVYEGENVSATAFAASTNQGFVRDELATDGTSGPFQLSQVPLVRNSETIVIETRDRFRPDVIVSERNLARFADYDIDFDTGEIILRTPAEVTDADLNPNVIVVEYETSSPVERNVTAGGRLAGRFLDGRVEVGATYIHEEGDNVNPDARSDLVGIDTTVTIDPYTEFRAEYAYSASEAVIDGVEESTDANAFLLEVVRRQESYAVSAFYRREEAGFGLGQVSSGTGGFERFGVTGSARIYRKETKDGATIDHNIRGQVLVETNLTTGDDRTIAEVGYEREGPTLSANVGLRNVQENVSGVSDGRRQSLLLTSGVRKSFNAIGLTLSATHEQPLGSDDADEVTQFPQRTILGVDKTLTSRATLNIRHEILDGVNASGQNTVAGLTVRPWTGGEVSVAADTITSDSGRRIGATIGLDQTFQINDQWSLGFGTAHRSQIDDDDGEEPADPLADEVLSPLETAPASPLTGTDGFTSAFLGAGYRNEDTAVSARVEARDSALGQRYIGTLGAARQASEKLSFALAARIQRDVFDTAPDQRRAEARFGVAWRPRGTGPIVFNQLDVLHDNTFGESKSTRIINNLGVNTYLTRRTQLAGFYGVRYSNTEIGPDRFDGFTHLIGGEIRHDVTERFDIGFSGAALIDQQTGTRDFSYGPSVGYSPGQNIWASFGWNVEGFADDDFRDAEFTRNGPYFKLRVKFDQNTAASLLKKLSPNNRIQ